MYNRYIRNDQGVYTRIKQPDGPQSRHIEGNFPPPPPPETQRFPQPPPPEPETDRNILNRLLKTLHLGDLDSGDLLLLLILFLLFQEKADEELLIAIGLLLIL